ncbi:MAG: ATP-binding protein [Desulfuromusa sp.]|nr:ATP-binding protein [Desulfuromusa sp.]
MTQYRETVKTPAPLSNVALLLTAVNEAIVDCREIGGFFVAFYGHAGYGKTSACNFVRSKVRGIRVECCDHWTRKALLQAILFEMSIPAARNINEMFNQVVTQLRASQRPLILDEADHLIKPSMIEMVRNMMDKSRVPVILSGEELLVKKLERWERAHSRILKPVAAQPANMNDIAMLANMYCPNVTIAEDWLTELHKQTGGNTRRVVVNLNRAKNEAQHLSEISLSSWADRGWHTGRTPAPRRAV